MTSKRTFGSVSSEIDPFLRFFKTEVIDQFFSTKKWRSHAKFSLMEIIGNAWKHGNREDPEKKITVEWRTEGDVLTISVEDEGDGFVPKSSGEKPPFGQRGGYGLGMTRDYVSSLEFSERGNRVTFTLNKKKEVEI
jgi:anti-sigma regulatory factor (Ser/Thr protein kinase)